jgi:quinol monooxygenase YgiN
MSTFREYFRSCHIRESLVLSVDDVLSLTERSTDVHAVVFQVDMKQGWEGRVDAELDQLVTMVKSVPGFVRGTWTTDGRRGLSFLLFESQESAEGLAANAAMPPDASVTLRSADVYEVTRDV